MSENKFDICILILPQEEPKFAKWKTHLKSIPQNKRHILELGESKKDACEKLAEIEKLKGLASLVPIKYRIPKINLVEAKAIATKHLNKFNEERNTDFVLSDRVDYSSFYYVFSGEPIMEGGSPIFHIHYTDGHIVDFPEVAEFKKITDCDY